MKITLRQLRQIIQETISEETIKPGAYRKTRMRGMGHCSEAFKDSDWFDKTIDVDGGYAPFFRQYFYEEPLPRGKKNYRTAVEEAKKRAVEKAVKEWSEGNSSIESKLRAAVDIDVAPFKEGVGAICVAVLILATEYEKIMNPEGESEQ